MRGSGLEQIFSAIPMDIPQDKTMMTPVLCHSRLWHQKEPYRPNGHTSRTKYSILQLFVDNSDLSNWAKYSQIGLKQ